MDQNAQAVLQKSSCKLCKTINPATVKCIQCDKDMCTRCKTSHQRIPLTKDHTYQQIYDLLPPEISNCTDLVLCKTHHKGVIVYCSACEKLVCPECISEEHDKHTLEKIDTIYEKKKPSFDAVSNDAIAYKSELISKKKFITNRRANLELEVEGLKSAIEQRKNFLIKKIQNDADGLLLCLNTNKIKAIKSTTKIENTLSTTISGIETSVSTIHRSVKNKARCMLEFENLKRKLTPRFKENLTLPTAEMFFEDETKYIFGHLNVQDVTTDLESCSCCHNVMTEKLMLPICKHVLCQECGSKIRYSRICPVCQYSYKIVKRKQPKGNIIVEVRDECFVIRYSFVDQNPKSRYYREEEFVNIFITILPRNSCGQLLFGLLQTAFDRGLLFHIDYQETSFKKRPQREQIMADKALVGIIDAYDPKCENCIEENVRMETLLWREKKQGKLRTPAAVTLSLPDEKQLEHAIEFLGRNGVIEVDLNHLKQDLKREETL